MGTTTSTITGYTTETRNNNHILRVKLRLAMKSTRLIQDPRVIQNFKFYINQKKMKTKQVQLYSTSIDSIGISNLQNYFPRLMQVSFRQGECEEN